MYNSASAPPASYLQVRRSLRKISHSVHLNGPFNHKMIFETSPVMRGRRSTGAVPIRWIAPPVCCLYTFSNCSLFSQDFCRRQKHGSSHSRKLCSTPVSAVLPAPEYHHRIPPLSANTCHGSISSIWSKIAAIGHLLPKKPNKLRTS